MKHFTLKEIEDMRASGEISATEAIQLRIETRKAIEAGKADEKPAKQPKQKRKPEPEEEEEEEPAAIAPPPKQQKRKQQPAKDKQPAKQPAKAEKPKVEKYDIPGATEVEYCPTAVIFLGEGRYPNTYAFKIGKEVSVRNKDAWSLLSYELYSEPVGEFIREQIGL